MISVKCKKCRRAGQKLFLKGDRCFTPKCAMIQRPYPPGLHGKRRSTLSEYGRQLLEKQKIKNIYGVLERQFRRYIREIARKKGDKRDLLFKKLEKRLDNVVYRLGFARSRSQARQIVSHGHIVVNHRKVDRPSYEVKVNDVIGIRPHSQNLPLFKDLKDFLKKHEIPSWLRLDVDKLEARVISDITELDPNVIHSLGMIIEFYSR